MTSDGRQTAQRIAALLVGRGIRVQHVHATDTGTFIVFIEQLTGRVDEAVAVLEQHTTGFTVRRVAPAVIRLDPAPEAHRARARDHT